MTKQQEEQFATGSPDNNHIKAAFKEIPSVQSVSIMPAFGRKSKNEDLCVVVHTNEATPEHMHYYLLLAVAASVEFDYPETSFRFAFRSVAWKSSPGPSPAVSILK